MKKNTSLGGKTSCKYAKTWTEKNPNCFRILQKLVKNEIPSSTYTEWPEFDEKKKKIE